MKRHNDLWQVSRNYVTHGPNDIEIDVAGFTVSQVEESLAEVLNLGAGVQCYVDGILVRDKENFVLDHGCTVFFWKAFGFKGSGDFFGERQMVVLERIAQALERLADHVSPPNRTTVGTRYIAERLGISTKWVGDLVRSDEIPKSCICPKSGGGKYWRFWKVEVDQWIEER